MNAVPLQRKLFSPIDARLAAPTGWPELDQATLLHPPDEWFSDETADTAGPNLRYLASGQVIGVVGPAGRCLLDGQPDCWTLPRPTDGRGSAFDCPDLADYRMAHVGHTVLASGAEIPTATIAGAGGHHSYFSRVTDPAKSEYADIGRAVARVRYVWSDKAGGLVAVGALMPTIDEVKAATLGCSAVSVDYRYIADEGAYRLLGSTLVNIGGLPSRYSRPIIAGASVIVPEIVLAAASEPTSPKETTMTTDTCSCGGTKPKMAAYQLVPSDGLESGAAVQWGNGTETGRYQGSVPAVDGTVLYLVVPLVDGELDDDNQFAIPADQCEATGMRFQYDWDDSSDNRVMIGAAADGPVAASTDVPATEATTDQTSEVNSRLDNLEAQSTETLALVTDLHTWSLDAQLAAQPAIPEV